MKLLNRQTLAQDAPARWAEQYGDGRWPEQSGKIDKLAALKAPINPDDVDRIIGNTSWTAPPRCHECNKCPPEVIELGDEPDYESSTTWVCVGCLKAALSLFSPVKD